MPLWQNKDLVVYHGTDDLSVHASHLAAGASLAMTVNLALCRPFTDFGQGFYVTTSLHQAKQWANSRALRRLAPTGPVPNAIVISFRLSRDWLASLEALVFVRPTKDFWDLVEDCRNGFPPHQRSSGAYDVVYGPVTIWPQRLIIQDCDQISFHTSGAAGGLPPATIHAKSTGTSAGPGTF
jgi:Protein of unknown function (DUF3990)